MPLVLCGIDTGTMASHDQKHLAAPQFDYLDIMNVMMTLTMLSTSCNANISANGVT